MWVGPPAEWMNPAGIWALYYFSQTCSHHEMAWSFAVYGDVLCYACDRYWQCALHCKLNAFNQMWLHMPNTANQQTNVIFRVVFFFNLLKKILIWLWWRWLWEKQKQKFQKGNCWWCLRIRNVSRGKLKWEENKKRTATANEALRHL